MTKHSDPEYRNSVNDSLRWANSPKERPYEFRPVMKTVLKDPMTAIHGATVTRHPSSGVWTYIIGEVGACGDECVFVRPSEATRAQEGGDIQFIIDVIDERMIIDREKALVLIDIEIKGG